MNYRLVDCSIQEIKPYQHTDLWWSPTFLCWTFCGQTALDHPYASSNQIAERLGLFPNPRAVQNLWIGWFRASRNEYEYARLVSAVDIGHAYASSTMQTELQYAPIVKMNTFQLPPLGAEESGILYADRLLDLRFSASNWTQRQRRQFLDDLSLACFLGHCGQEHAGVVDRLFSADYLPRA